MIGIREFCAASRISGINKSVSKLLITCFKDGGGAFEAHAGVHRRLRQGIEVAGSVAIELHEDEVPDFDVAAAVAGKRAVSRCAIWRSRVVNGCDAHIVENFAAGAAGAGVAHGPEIIFQAGNRKDAVFGRADI